MPEGRDTTIEVRNIMSFVLYAQILKQSVLKPASPGITLNTPIVFHVFLIGATDYTELWTPIFHQQLFGVLMQQLFYYCCLLYWGL